MKNMELLCKISAVLALACAANAATVVVPNYSFETPEVPNTTPALPFFEAWQHTPQPDWYQEDPQDPRTQWANLAGVFPNIASGQPGNLENLDQKQGAYLFSLPSNGIFQELSTRFEVGQMYSVTAGFVASSALSPADGTTIALSLYFRDSAGGFVTIASTNITFNSANFPTNTHLIDFTATSAPIKSLDASVGKNIGVMIVSTSPFDKAGGVWDIDNVRVRSFGVVNGSFEAPVVPNTVPALPFFDAWQRPPKPDWYQEDPQDARTHWANLAGVFPNPASGETGHITNMDEKQGAFIFAIPSNGIFQETPATFEQGVSYTLNVGFVGSATFPPPDGTTMQIGLYYRDGANMVPVATKDVVYNSSNFPTLTAFVDFSATTPFVSKTDAWYGKNIGVSIITTVATSGGIWDVDNVRLTANALQIQFSVVGGNLHITFPTKTGFTYRLQTSTDLVSWTDFSNPVTGNNAEGSVDVPLSTAPGQAFFKLKVTAAP